MGQVISTFALSHPICATVLLLPMALVAAFVAMAVSVIALVKMMEWM